MAGRLDGRTIIVTGGASGIGATLASGILLGGPANPVDIVPTSIFLAASDSDYITGQIIPIEGGTILV